MKHLGDGARDVRAAGRSENGHIRVGIFSSLASGFLCDLFQAYDADRPGVRIDFSDGHPADHIAAVRLHQLDVAFVTGTAEHAGCETTPLWREQVFAVLPATHPLTVQQSLVWQDLIGETFIVSEQAPGREIYDFLVKRLSDQLALFEGAGPIDDLAARAAPPDAAARSLLRVSLANYLAAAVLMPYGPFLAAVEAAGYDVERVKSRFGVSFEQGCHRLTTLSRPGARGIPFFMLRIDPAGNVSKRFASASFPFARFSGACPRWNIHASFRVPGRVVTQVVETPDGERYFTLARTVRRPGAGPSDEADLAIGLGCELRHAGKLVHARGLDLAAPLVTPIGPACRICERPECPARAAQPVSRTLMVDDFRKTLSPYPFAPG